MKWIRSCFKYGICILKLLFIRVILELFYRKLLKQNIWLIEEKRTEARDNGYHLFKYLSKNHPEKNTYFVIAKDSADYEKVSKVGNVIIADSFQHYLYYVAAKFNIGSQPYGAAPQPAPTYFNLRGICRKGQRTVFLQHGITKDDLPMLYYNRTHFDLFVSGAKPEYDYILSKFGYNEKNLKLLGFCRFDNLNNYKPKKMILVMPTFRKSLVAEDREHPAKENEMQVFKQSIFYNGFSSLLSNEKLNFAMREKGYQLVYYMHYSFQSFNKCFERFGNESIIIADRMHYDVQQLLLDSSILVTDFSSVFFDFAYMKKPEVFFQPDEEEYRINHYAKGYFDYRLNGFGPVFNNVEETVDYLVKLIECNCEMETDFQKRVDAFFTIRDTKNCERTFKAIDLLE